MIRRLGLAGIAMLVGVLLSDALQTAEAAHNEYLVENPKFNPAGGTSSSGLVPTLWGVQPPWVFDGEPFSICSDWGPNYSNIPLGVQQALNDWENVLPGTQFHSNCGAYSAKLWFKSRAETNQWDECSEGTWACVEVLFEYNVMRDANYPQKVQKIWIDDLTLTHTTDGMRALAGHELGHIFGLDEAYLGDEIDPVDPQCSSVNSVMNMQVRIGQVITAACPLGSSSPTQRDIDLVQSFYQPEPPYQWIPANTAPWTVQVQFKDRAWAEFKYFLYIDRWSGGQWLPVIVSPYSLNVGQKDFWHTRGYTLPTIYPAANYRMCASAYTELYGLSGVLCSAAFFLTPDSDADGDSWGDSVDNCPNWFNITQVQPSWNIPANDPDCDSFTTTIENFVGTDPTRQCAANSTANNEGLPDRWPVDFDDNQSANSLDVAKYVPLLNTFAPGPPYIVRLDLTADGKINTHDIAKFIPLLNMTCTP